MLIKLYATLHHSSTGTHSVQETNTLVKKMKTPAELAGDR
jgi:hypothetical protein